MLSCTCHHRTRLLNMVLLKLLIFMLSLFELTISLDATKCPKGQRVVITRGFSHCEDCQHGYFQPEEHYSQRCKVCTRCDEGSGSYTVKICTKETNTKCQCRGKFVPSDNDSSSCLCDIGFGLKDGDCLKCEAGYFSKSINSVCKKWKECKSTGENITGTATSDVVCNEEDTSPTMHVTPHHPHEGTQTQTKLTTMTTSAPRHIFTPNIKAQPSYPSNPGNPFGIFIILAIVGLLLLTTLTCKLYVTPHSERQQAVQKHESLCRRPVEESGDSSRLSLKQNPGGP